MTMTQMSPADTKPIADERAVLDITVVAGGPGAEREVSFESGRAVLAALQRLGHQAVLHDIGPADLSALEVPADFVFIALHGEFGEDGTVQAKLDAKGLRYCGSGATASQLAMDKVASKRCFEQADIPTPAYAVVSAACMDKPGDLENALSGMTVPVVVKPVASGSSVDTTIARSIEALHKNVRAVVAAHGQALVERYIDGPELTVAILGDRALPVCEIRPAGEFYDYHAKYIDDRTEYRFDLDLPASLLERVQRLSERVHHLLGCAVFSRVDWMVDRRTLEPFVLEVNTIPGFTSHSLVPKAAARIGLGFDDLCERIVRLSMKKEPR